MHRKYLVAVILCTCQALAWTDPLCARDENAAAAASKPKPAHERLAQADTVIDRIRSSSLAIFADWAKTAAQHSVAPHEGLSLD